MDFDHILKRNSLKGVSFRTVQIPEIATVTDTASSSQNITASGVTDNANAVTASLSGTLKRKSPYGATLDYIGRNRNAEEVAQANLEYFNYGPSQGGFFVNPDNISHKSPESQWHALRHTLFNAENQNVDESSHEVEGGDPDALIRAPRPRTAVTSDNMAVVPLNVPTKPVHVEISSCNRKNDFQAGSSNVLPRMPEIKNLDAILHFSNSDAKIAYELIDGSVPNNLRDSMAKLSPSAVKRARLQQQLLSAALFREDYIRSKVQEARLREQSKLVKDLDEDLIRMRAEITKLERKNASLKVENDTLKAEATSANEARMKAEHELEGTRDLAEKEAQAMKDLVVAHKDIAEANILLDSYEAEIAATKASEMDALKELEMLRTAIPSIFYKAIQSPAVMGPFNRLLEASQSVGSVDMLSALSQHVVIPDPLPRDVSQLVDKDCYDKQEKEVKALKELSVPFIEQIGGLRSLSGVHILSMDPNST